MAVLRDDVLLALLGTGGALVILLTWGRELTQFWTGDSARRRAEWINEVAVLRQRLDTLEAQADRWQKLYYEQVSANAALKAKITTLEVEVANLRARIAAEERRP